MFGASQRALNTGAMPAAPGSSSSSSSTSNPSASTSTTMRRPPPLSASAASASGGSGRFVISSRPAAVLVAPSSNSGSNPNTPSTTTTTPGLGTVARSGAPPGLLSASSSNRTLNNNGSSTISSSNYNNNGSVSSAATQRLVSATSTSAAAAYVNTSSSSTTAKGIGGTGGSFRTSADTLARGMTTSTTTTTTLPPSGSSNATAAGAYATTGASASSNKVVSASSSNGSGTSSTRPNSGGGGGTSNRTSTTTTSSSATSLGAGGGGGAKHASGTATTTTTTTTTTSNTTGNNNMITSLQKRELLKFTLKDLIMSTTVGTGTFGRVRVVQYKPTRTWYALKILKKSEIIRLRQVEHIQSEVKILAQISHPFIVNMLGFLTDERRLYMLFDYVPGGELFSHLRRAVKFSNDAARFYAAEIVLAFEYLHTFNIVYRDLKPENLLLTNKGHVKITDFGFAKVVDDRTYTLCGTPEYLAPEIIQSLGHNKGADWWAIGILIFEMLAGFPPFFDETPYGIYQKILANKIEWPKHFSLEARDLIKKLLTADRTRRLGCLFAGAKDIKEHPWFAGISWDAVYACSLPAPLVPKVKDANDTSNFDDYPDSDGDTAGKLTSKDADLFTDLDKF